MEQRLKLLIPEEIKINEQNATIHTNIKESIKYNGFSLPFDTFKSLDQRGIKTVTFIADEEIYSTFLVNFYFYGKELSSKYDRKIILETRHFFRGRL